MLLRFMPNCCVFPTGAYFPLTQCSYFQAEKSLVEFAKPTKSDCFYGSEIHRTSISEIRSREYFFLLTKGVCVCFPIRCYHFNKLRYAFFRVIFYGISRRWVSAEFCWECEERAPKTRMSKKIGYQAPLNLSCLAPLNLSRVACWFVSDTKHL